MTITKAMFNGQSTDTAWINLAPFVGHRFDVQGWAPTKKTGVDRTVRLAGAANSLPAVSHGIAAWTDAAVDLQSDAIGGSTFRWDTAVLRCNRSARTVTPTLVKGTGNVEVISGGVATFHADCKFAVSDAAAGVWDIPIALCQVTSASAEMAQVIDIRPFGGIWPWTTFAPPLDWWTYGAHVIVAQADGGEGIWVRRTAWQSLSRPTAVSSPAISWGSGWANDGTQLFIYPDRLVIDLAVKRTAGGLTSDGNGNIGDSQVSTFPVPFRARSGREVVFSGGLLAPGSYGWHGRLTQAGIMYLSAITAGNLALPAGSTYKARVVIDRVT